LTVIQGDGDDFAPVAAKSKAAAAPAPAAPAAAAAAPKANNSQPRNNGPRRDNRNRNQGDREVNAAVPVGEGAKEDRGQSCFSQVSSTPSRVVLQGDCVERDARCTARKLGLA
jgi:pyruvate/2-oxoglutarate dehydrogenase complex dihydrolipoamide acyltransferase (E2) component